MEKTTGMDEVGHACCDRFHCEAMNEAVFTGLAEGARTFEEVTIPRPLRCAAGPQLAHLARMLLGLANNAGRADL